MDRERARMPGSEVRDRAGPAQHPGTPGKRSLVEALSAVEPAPGKHTRVEALSPIGPHAGDTGPAIATATADAAMGIARPATSPLALFGRPAAPGPAGAMPETAAAVRDGLRRESFAFTDSRGEPHQLFLDDQLRPMMHSDLIDLLAVLRDRSAIRQSPEQHELVLQGRDAVLKIVNLTKVADALITGGFATKGDDEEALVDLLMEVVTKPMLGKQTRVPSDMAMAGSDGLTDLGGWTHVKPARTRVEREQVNSLVKGVNRVLRDQYGALAKILGGLNPPLQAQTRSTTGKQPGQPGNAAERDAQLKRYFLPRTDFKYSSTHGSMPGTIKPLEVAAINISPHRAEGSAPESGSDKEVAGYPLVKKFRLTGEGPNWVRMHLINDKLGGRGIPENLTPGPNAKNQQMQRQFEKPLKQLVERDQDNTDVVWIRAKVTHHPSAPIEMSDDAKEFVKKKNLSIDASDFASRIDLEAGISSFKDGSWAPVLTSGVAAPPVNLELPKICLPTEWGHVDRKATADGTQTAGKPKITKHGEATQPIAELLQKLSTTPTNVAEYQSCIDDAIKLLALPQTYGAKPVDRPGINKRAEAALEKLKTYVSGDLARRLDNARGNATQYGQLDLEGRTLRAWITDAHDRLGKGSDAISMPPPAPFSLGMPLPAQEESTQKEQDQALQIELLQRELESSKAETERLKQQLAQLKRQLELQLPMATDDGSTADDGAAASVLPPWPAPHRAPPPHPHRQPPPVGFRPQQLGAPMFAAPVLGAPAPASQDDEPVAPSPGKRARIAESVEPQHAELHRPQDPLEAALSDPKRFVGYGHSREYDLQMKPVAKALGARLDLDLSVRCGYVRVMAMAFHKADPENAGRDRLQYLFTCAGAAPRAAATEAENILRVT